MTITIPTLAWVLPLVLIVTVVHAWVWHRAWTRYAWPWLMFRIELRLARKYGYTVKELRAWREAIEGRDSDRANREGI